MGYPSSLLKTTQSQILTTLKQMAFENIVGKGENHGNQHFLLFPQCFLLFPNQTGIFHLHSCADPDIFLRGGSHRKRTRLII